MDAMIELQKQLDTLLTELIYLEEVAANHFRIVGHITDADKKETARIRYQCLELIERAFVQGKKSYADTMLRYKSTFQTSPTPQTAEHDKVQKNRPEPQLFQ